MSLFISTSPAAFPSHSSALACVAMPSSGLISYPLLAPKGHLMKHSTAVLPVLIIVSIVLLASSCDARGLPVHGKVRSSSRKSHRLLGKVGIGSAEDYAWLDVAARSLKADGWLSRQMEATHRMPQQPDAKAEEGMKMAAAYAGAVRATPTPTPAVTVSQRLSRREDTGFHLDYAGPRTHTPSHN